MVNKILLIDDSKTQLDVLRMKFSKCGYEVVSVTNAFDAYSKIFSFVPDVILSDIIMPELDGYQFCRLLKNNEITRNIPIILVTVLDKKLDKFWGKKAGAQAFISKEDSFDSICKKVEETLQKSNLTEENKKTISEYNFKNDTTSVETQITHILSELLMQSTFLNEFRNLNEYFSQEKYLVEHLFDLMSSFIEYDIAGIFFNPPDENSKKILYFDTNNVSVSTFVIENLKRTFFAQIPNLKQFNTNDFVHELILKPENNPENKILSINTIKTSFILPLEFKGKVLGGVGFFSKNETDYRTFKFFNILYSELRTLFEMKSLYNEVEMLSVTDALTSLYNRRYFEFNLQREFLRAKRYKNQLSMAILDIDFFKSVNDTYGHQCGDYVLKEVSRLIKESSRVTDLAYRYGGEELTIIMPETSMEIALILLNRIHKKIETTEFEYDGAKFNLTVSIGLSEMRPEYKDPSELVNDADKALYQAKQAGRNKVVTYNG